MGDPEICRRAYYMKGFVSLPLDDLVRQQTSFFYHCARWSNTRPIQDVDRDLQTTNQETNHVAGAVL